MLDPFLEGLLQLYERYQCFAERLQIDIGAILKVRVDRYYELDARL